MPTCILQEKSPESQDQKPTLPFTPTSFELFLHTSLIPRLTFPLNLLLSALQSDRGSCKNEKNYSAVGLGAVPSDSVART